MSTKTNDSKLTVKKGEGVKPHSLMPITRLVSRPSIRIVNGVLSAVKELNRSAA